ncbi:Serine/threonine-protein phosphatase 6 regulatory ankyrin repeat subunit A [Morus notabilis]|uniref:Serine/threonine-protein phosphatase 6 regulatory ankyrin repeat subunit A n=2 Tax=Morus notabilis TaxID=981085 RepID=W9QYR9_9ROSA|nr:Serine/threonine-protein phosphatase 6 regulatory ankyrin repeat subunit A [Morus notabilis]
MESLVEVSDQEVRIDFALNCKCRANVRLRSLCATSPVAFKVQTSSPHKFMVNPPSGLIPPLSYGTFQIILKPQAQLPQAYPRSPSDRFLIKTAQFPSTPGPAHHPESVTVTSWFASRSANAPPTQDHKLKVAFVGPFLLRHAVGRGDYDAARNIIKRQKSILSQLPPTESESLLRVATELADPESMLNLLLESGLKIGARVEPDDARASRGWDALHAAAALDRTDEVVELVRTMRGCGSLDRGDREGKTPLHVAAEKGNIRCARVLVESGADKDARSRDGRTALHRAAANGDRPMVEMLMEMGADPTNPNDRGRLPIDVARDKGHSKVVEILERGEAVLMAARRGDSRHLESLLKTGATISHRDQYGLTALHAAAMKGHKDVVLMLIEFGLDLESPDNEGHSPLHLAVVGGSLDTVVALVIKGANINIKNNRSATPLYMATAMGHHDIAEFLITKGASSSL